MGVTVLPYDESAEAALDGCQVLESPLQHEIRAGNRLGVGIRTDDDEDTGLQQPLLLTIGDRRTALEKARQLKKIMLDYGVPEVSIELQEGRPNDYGVYDALFMVAEMSHHTVSRYQRDGLTPVLSLCKNGRPGLPGPLCNGYGGWDLCYRIITLGYANHSGVGGPYTVPALTAGEFTIPEDSGRRYMWGTEWEGGLDESDWDRVLKNPRTGARMTFREFMGRSNAALEAWGAIHPRAHLEHSTWTNRKIDRLGYSAREGIQEKAPYRMKGDAVATKEDIQRWVANTPIIVDVDKQEGEHKTWSLQRTLRHIINQLDKMTGDKLAAAIVDELPTNTGTLTAEDIQDAVERGVRKVLGSLD